LWSQNDVITVEAESHLKLLLASILDLYKVFEHINMLLIGLRDIGLGDKLDGNNNDKNNDDENHIDAALLCCILQGRVGASPTYVRVRWIL
jgi:hypothetical protein